MSDATLPALPPAPTAPDSQLSTSSGRSSSEGDAYPFLIHSQQSIINGSSPELDNGKLARQKRKRTSPEDQVTLEAEYKRNPKPDKAARAEILKRVCLGEKEVQIWFQNRRQNTRRKTRPLLPHEIAAFGLGGMAALSPASILGGTYGATKDPEGPLSTMTRDCREQRHSFSDLQMDQPKSTLLEATENLGNTEVNQDIAIPFPKSIDITVEPQLRVSAQSYGHQNISQKFPTSQSLPATSGYLANRRNARASSLSTPKSSAAPMFTASFSQTRSPPSSCPGNISEAKASLPSSSQVRLSLSLDGKAELISAQVSPPRLQQTQASSSATTVTHRRLSLKRCQSDITSSNTSHKLASHMPPMPRVPSRRSRDARTWEFCCDTDARDELTTQAENESSGSALAAISLLRSTSTSSLKNSGSKRNAPVANLGTVHGKKPKLNRVSSSLPRLQSSHKSLLVSPSGDSDKENWLPQDTSGNSRRRNHMAQLPSKQKRRRVLEESKTSSTHTSVPDSKNNNSRKPVFMGAEILEDTVERKGDREVDKFMRGEVSPSKKGDLDCIQGLLSLSQGTWR